jgi:hypothetical protein
LQHHLQAFNSTTVLPFLPQNPGKREHHQSQGSTINHYQQQTQQQGSINTLNAAATQQ